MRYPFIEQHRGVFAVRAMCRVMQVAPSGYYAWRQRSKSSANASPHNESGQSRANRRLLVHIRRIHQESFKTYGSPRIHAELNASGQACGVNRVARLMRRHGIRARQKRRFKTTTQACPSLPVAPNLLERDFAADAPNQKWAADITYIWTHEGWLYLAVVLDLASRRVIGWAMQRTLEQSLATSALEMALTRRRPGSRPSSGPSERAHSLIHHSDRGSQYASTLYQALLARQRITCSMSRRGDCYDNAVVESFFGTLKTERIHHQTYQTRSQAKADVFAYIETWYNPRRRHSSLGYLSPVAYEAACEAERERSLTTHA